MTKPEIKDHLERDVKTVCAYCGKNFDVDEVVIEREIHGRTWRFCGESCYNNFNDAYDYRENEFEEDEDELRPEEE